MAELAYEPTEDFKGLTGATIAGPNGETIDLKKLLDDTEHGNAEGVIVTDNEFLQGALDFDFRFKRTNVPDGYGINPETGLTATAVRKMLKAELQEAYQTKYGHPAPDATNAKLMYLLLPGDFPDPDAGTVQGQTPLEPDGTPTAAITDDEPDAGEED